VGLRVAVVAGPDPGHAFPAVALCVRLGAAGHAPVLYTGRRWLDRVRAEGVDAAELPGVVAEQSDPDTDPGYRLHGRAARMAPALVELFGHDRPDVVVADTLTAVGGLAAELAGVPWLELVPHPLHLASVALPPPGSGLAPGRTPLGRGRDALLRRLHARSVALGRGQRAAARASIGLPADDPGPTHRLVATLWPLEPARPDWPPRTDVVGPLHWEPAQADLPAPPGAGPLVLVSPSTATVGRGGLLPAALTAVERLRAGGAADLRLAGTVLTDPTSDPAASDPAASDPAASDPAASDPAASDPAASDPAASDPAASDPAASDPAASDPAEWAAVGAGRQAPLLAAAAVVVAGAGHGMLAKALSAGVPLVLVPGAGDQRDLARRAARLGAAVVIERPPTAERLARAIGRALTDPGLRAAARAIQRGTGPYADPVRLCENAANRAE
jgi:UDP:flavonoid glycosyltransferase YjiC (YdhE family)